MDGIFFVPSSSRLQYFLFLHTPYVIRKKKIFPFYERNVLHVLELKNSILQFQSVRLSVCGVLNIASVGTKTFKEEEPKENKKERNR